MGMFYYQVAMSWPTSFSLIFYGTLAKPQRPLFPQSTRPHLETGLSGPPSSGPSEIKKEVGQKEGFKRSREAAAPAQLYL